MSSHGGHSHTGTAAVSAFSLETANELSWMLGERVTGEDDRAELASEWAHEGSRQQVAVFHVTAETAIVRFRSPAGRERYVGTTKDEARQACADLAAATGWHRVDGQ